MPRVLRDKTRMQSTRRAKLAVTSRSKKIENEPVKDPRLLDTADVSGLGNDPMHGVRDLARRIAAGLERYVGGAVDDQGRHGQSGQAALKIDGGTRVENL